MKKITLLLLLTVISFTAFAQVDTSIQIDTVQNVSRETIEKEWHEVIYDFKKRYNVSNATLAAWFTSELRQHGKNYRVTIGRVQSWERGNTKPSRSIQRILIPCLIEKSFDILEGENY